jgi:protein phosphatase
MHPIPNAHLYTTATTHPGKQGKNNEDRYAILAFEQEGEPLLPVTLGILADGVGGKRGGEIAAEMAIDIIAEAVAQSDGSEPLLTLQNAIIDADQKIGQRGKQMDEGRGMGTTVSTALIVGSNLYTAYVGNSRIYLLRAGKLYQLSTDHTWVQEAIEIGVLTPEQAKKHPQKNVITRAVGSHKDVVPDFRLRWKPGETDMQAEQNQGFLLKPGDLVFLCSDGLSDLVEDAEIEAYLKAGDTKKALDGLTELANERGGHDNITMIALGVPKETDKPVPTPKKPKRDIAWWFSVGCMALIVLAFLATIVGAAALSFFGN